MVDLILLIPGLPSINIVSPGGMERWWLGDLGG